MRAWVLRNLWPGVLFLSVLGAPSLSAQYTITTVAGGAPQPTPIAAVKASVGSPLGAATDGSGNVYFTSLNCVYKLDQSGVLTRVAGNSQPGFSGDGGPASAAQLRQPGGVALDSAGNLYIADTLNSTIRKVSIDGTITTAAGNAYLVGFSGDGGQATNAVLNYPYSVAVDNSGNIYIADTNNNRVRKVDTTGIITTAAGYGGFGFSGDGSSAPSAALEYPTGVAVDSSGNLYIADRINNRVRKVDTTGNINTVAGNGIFGYSGDGGKAISAEMLPYGVAVDGAGNIYIADLQNARIRKVSTSGIVTTVAGNGTFGYTGDGGTATSAALAPYGIASDSAGNLYIADAYDNRIRKVSGGNITTVAGNGTFEYSGDVGPAASAQLNFPSGVAADAAGNLYIADTYNNAVRQVSTTGAITTVAGTGAFGYFGDGGAATSAQLGQPSGLAVDRVGNLYIADTANSSIRKVSPAGTIFAVAGTGISGYSGDGGAAASAQLNLPNGVAVDSAGNLYIADSNNHRIRKVSIDGIMTTVAGTGFAGYSGDGGGALAAQLDQPSGIAVDSAGNLYIADTYNNVIRQVSAGGTITTVAGNGTIGYFGDGGPARNAQLNHPNGVAADRAGNLYIADSDNNSIREVTSAGIITTLAGNGTLGYSGDGGPAASAQLDLPNGVAVDGAGNVYIADALNNAVRLAQPASPPPNGQRNPARVPGRPVASQPR